VVDSVSTEGRSGLDAVSTMATPVERFLAFARNDSRQVGGETKPGAKRLGATVHYLQLEQK